MQRQFLINTGSFFGVFVWVVPASRKRSLFLSRLGGPFFGVLGVSVSRLFFIGFLALVLCVCFVSIITIIAVSIYCFYGSE